jgi:D-alanyl-D-alanine carboxypeptidase/D-alanyl-D-alanine-endopeptidase (penicillin-binding protein 4)
MNLRHLLLKRLPLSLVLCPIFVIVSSTKLAAQTTETNPPLQTWLQEAQIPQNTVGIVIAPAEGGKPLLSHNAEQAFNPASVMKLYTTYAALELLGAAHTWKTQIFSKSHLHNGTLTGDVFIKGSGDPSLKLQDVWRLLRELRLAGVQHIAGDWVLDRSVFAKIPSDPAQFDGEGTRPYNVQPDGLLMNFNATRLLFTPINNEAGTGWQVIADPLPLGWTTSSYITATRGVCGDWRSKLLYQFKPKTVGGIVIISGSIPSNCGQQVLYRAIAPAQDYASGLVQTLWTELGGTHAGNFRAGITPSNASMLTELESEPLANIIRDINKHSNNVMARMLYLNLAPIPQTNKAAAEEHLRAWLNKVGLNNSSLVFDNGSGLSRDERANPAALIQLLQYAYTHSMMPEFMSSLSVAGQDGTVAKRINTIAGSAHLKTGTLHDSTALAGYVMC